MEESRCFGKLIFVLWEKRKANKVESEISVENDVEGSDEELMMIETSLKNEVIEEEENGSESGSNPTESRKQSNVWTVSRNELT